MRRRESIAERRARRAEVDDPDLVFAAAARFLEARPRSVGEVRRRLASAGYRPDLVEGAISRLVDLGILDDAEFARAWIESRDRARPRGERALRQELALKGVDRGLVAELLAERADALPDGRQPDAEAAERVLAKHASALARLADQAARRQRAYALLARNGFDPDVCRDAVQAWVGREAPDDEEHEAGPG